MLILCINSIGIHKDVLKLKCEKENVDGQICRLSRAGPLKGRIIPFRHTDPRNSSPSLIIWDIFFYRGPKIHFVHAVLKLQYSKMKLVSFFNKN